MIVTGGCLCGMVAYEVRMPLLRFVNCHCLRCRKASGSSHAANVVVTPEAFRWARGVTACDASICLGHEAFQLHFVKPAGRSSRTRPGAGAR